MRPFNPFTQRRHQNVEVALKPCPDCHGTGAMHEEGEEIMCSKCSGSGEIAEKKTIQSANPNTFPKR